MLGRIYKAHRILSRMFCLVARYACSLALERGCPHLVPRGYFDTYLVDSAKDRDFRSSGDNAQWHRSSEADHPLQHLHRTPHWHAWRHCPAPTCSARPVRHVLVLTQAVDLVFLWLFARLVARASSSAVMKRLFRGPASPSFGGPDVSWFPEALPAEHRGKLQDPGGGTSG